MVIHPFMQLHSKRINLNYHKLSIYIYNLPDFVPGELALSVNSRKFRIFREREGLRAGLDLGGRDVRKWRKKTTAERKY